MSEKISQLRASEWEAAVHLFRPDHFQAVALNQDLNEVNADKAVSLVTCLQNREL